MKLNKKIMIYGLIIAVIILAGFAIGYVFALINNLETNNTTTDETLNDDTPSHYNNPVVNDIILDDDLFQDAPRDPFSYGLRTVEEYSSENVTINGDVITILVNFGGGCKNHIFELIGQTTFMESEPVQMNFVLSHDANNDACKALLSWELTFDLTYLKEAWQDAYQQESGTIIINIDGFDKPIFYEF